MEKVDSVRSVYPGLSAQGQEYLHNLALALLFLHTRIFAPLERLCVPSSQRKNAANLDVIRQTAEKVIQ
jgi:hypothetical protein